ncbi:MAG: Ig-like domain-containing protein [Melioribacteraceae bacterium]
MVKKSKSILILFAIFIWGCANQIPPGGGPVDIIPPQIIEVYPSNGTTNYNKNYFEIKFSEYVDKRTVRDAIFISPPLKYPLEYEWSGRTLKINFQDTLRKNTTYTITIGAGIEDLNNHNKMIEPFSFAFSTGEKIDSGKISGKIYDKDPAGVMVFAYKKNNNEINPSVKKPDFVSEVGKNGKYNLVGLSEGEYFVFAMKDKLRDFLYQKNEDEYGVQFKKIVLSKEIHEINNVDFFLTKEDTIAPKILNASMMDKNHILIDFNERIDSSKISVDNFYIIDSTINKKVIPKYLFKSAEKGNQFNLCIADTLIKENKIFLIAQNVYDVYGNINLKEEIQLNVETKKDTAAPKIVKIENQYPDSKTDFDNPVLTLKFDDGIEEDSLRNAISVIDIKENKYPFEINKIDDTSFDVILKSNLKQRSEYQLNINLSKLSDSAGNRVDSVYKYKFTTASELDFSGISGKVMIDNDTNDVIVVLESSNANKNIYKQKIDKQKNFNINKVLPGKYLLWSFIDKDKNGKYTFGSVNPFKFAEEFKFYPDTLNLRARWPVGDVILK